MSLLVLVLFSLIGACASEGSQEPTADGDPPELPRGEPGPIVVVGGGLQSDNLAVYQAVLDGRWGEGPLCVLPTASGSPTSSMDGYVSDFNAVAGEPVAQGVYLTLDNRQDAFSQSVADRLLACSGFFFTGGSQSRILDVFRPGGQDTPAYQAIWDRHQAGAVVAGSSAGAAIMSDPMIAGGSSEGALSHGIRRQAEGDGVWLRQGMGFLAEGIAGQHFLTRGRWGRLVVALLGTEGETMGYGVDENTALVFFGATAEVIGESEVVFFDTRLATSAEGNGGRGIRAYLLGSGDTIALETGLPAVNAERSPLSAASAEPLPESPDLFGSMELRRILLALAAATDTTVTYSHGDHRVEFRKGPGFMARSWDDDVAAATPGGLFLGPFVLNVWLES
jgi:cyanophycinase